MTHLKQAQDRLKVELEAQPHCSGFAAGANFILGILDEQEKRKTCGCNGLSPEALHVPFSDSCKLEKPKSLKEQGYTIEYDPVADRHSAVAPKPKECRKDMAFGTEDYIPCRLPIGHVGEHSDVPAPTPYTPTPVPEELRISAQGARTSTIVNKLNELIRWARSLQPRNQ